MREEFLPRIVAAFLKTGATIEQIAAQLQMDVKMIQCAAQSDGASNKRNL